MGEQSAALRVLAALFSGNLLNELVICHCYGIPISQSCSFDKFSVLPFSNNLAPQQYVVLEKTPLCSSWTMSNSSSPTWSSQTDGSKVLSAIRSVSNFSSPIEYEENQTTTQCNVFECFQELNWLFLHSWQSRLRVCVPASGASVLNWFVIHTLTAEIAMPASQRLNHGSWLLINHFRVREYLSSTLL